jgi:O-antigen/teichoic acid export membrane protein
MSSIRRQSIISSAIVYFGFGLGFLNTYFFTRSGGFSQEQYGLLGEFTAIANLMFSLANMGTLAYIYKFYPYYDDHLSTRENDMITWSLVISILGFVLVISGGYVFRNLFARKFQANSPDLVKYYAWTFLFGFGLTMYSLLEALAWQLKKSVLTNYLREIQYRLFITLLIVLSVVGVVGSFDIFIKLFAFSYLILALILIVYLIASKKIHLTLRISRVTRKFYKKAITLAAFVWGGGLVYNSAFVFNSLVIAAVMPNGLASVGTFTLAQYIGSLIQAPQRGIISASTGPLSKAWKDKDYKKIDHIYHRSSINQLIFATGMFVLIWLNFNDGVITFNLQKAYFEARNVFFFIGLLCIIDMGTGVSAQILATSVFWKFEFYTGFIVLLLSLPLNYILTKHLGVIGPAIATLVAFSVYNGIRFVFLLRRFKMQPFTLKTAQALTLATAGYLICHLLYQKQHGFFWLFLRSITFIFIFLSGIVLLKLSPDVLPVWNTVKKRLGLPHD